MLIPVIIANSATIAVGEVVKIDTSGFAANGVAAAPILGIAVGFANFYDAPLTPTAYSAGVATSSDVQSVTAASDNQTVAMKMVIVESSTKRRWSAQVNGTIGSNGASGKIGAYIDNDSANSHYDRVLESTATRTASTCTNFVTYGLDLSDSTRIVVGIRASQLNGNVS